MTEVTQRHIVGASEAVGDAVEFLLPLPRPVDMRFLTKRTENDDLQAATLSPRQMDDFRHSIHVLLLTSRENIVNPYAREQGLFQKAKSAVPCEKTMTEL